MEDYSCDVEAAIVAVERNYAGYADKRERFGSDAIREATEHARAEAGKISTSEECNSIIQNWLDVFRDGHLSLVTRDAKGKLFNYSRNRNPRNRTAAARSSEPTAKILSDDTCLVIIPSFGLKHKASIDALIKQFDPEIRRRANLVIDLRGNTGGSDSSYGALSPYLYTQPVHAIGVDALATRANADAWEALLSDIPECEDGVRTQVRQIARKMRAAPEGTFLPIVGDQTMTLDEVFPLPSKVAILIDRKCTSTTEEFLLEARQSKKVTLFGESTGGVLDYANVRSFDLPSGRRALSVPTTRSRRLPAHPVDNVGISPDVCIENLDMSEATFNRIVEAVHRYWRAQ